MFWTITAVREIMMQPQTFGPELKNEVCKSLYSSVQGTIDSQYGYMISVVSILDIGCGFIREGGYAVYSIEFIALVCRPFVGQVIDVRLESVTADAVLGVAGPVTVLVSKKNMPKGYRYDLNNCCYYSVDEESVKLEKGKHLRVYLQGVDLKSRVIYCVGTIDSQYLGSIN